MIMKMPRLKYLLIIILLSLFNTFYGLAQLPDFRIALIDSTYYGTKNIDKNKPVLFMYFSLSCNECKEAISTLIASMDKLKDTQIIMITYESLTTVTGFVSRYNLTRYKNLKVGTEGYTGRFIRNFQIEELPFLVFYSEKGVLVRQHKKTVPIKDFLYECSDICIKTKKTNR